MHWVGWFHFAMMKWGKRMGLILSLCWNSKKLTSLKSKDQLWNKFPNWSTKYLKLGPTTKMESF